MNINCQKAKFYTCIEIIWIMGKKNKWVCKKWEEVEWKNVNSTKKIPNNDNNSSKKE